MEDTTLCGGGVCFDLEEGSSSSGIGGHTSLGEGCSLIFRRGVAGQGVDLEGSATSTGGGTYLKQWSRASRSVNY